MSNQEQEFSFKSLFVPFTTIKAMHYIVIIGIVVFFKSLFNPFILDDIPQIVLSADVHTLQKIPSFFYTSLAYPGISTLQVLHIYYKPLLFTTYTLLCSTFSCSPFPFHGLQIVLHIINTLLVFLILSRFINKSLSFFLSLIFLVHPINSETVIYIANMQDVLFVFFGLLAFYLVLRKKQTIFSFAFLSGIASLLLFSLLSKETGILFPLLLLFYVFLFVRKNSKRVLFAITGTLITYLVLRFIASFHTSEIITLSLMQQRSFSERIVSIPRIIFYYISTFILPIHLATGQDWYVGAINFSGFFLPLFFDMLFFVCILAGGIFLYKRKKSFISSYIFFSLWFLLGLSVHIQLFPLDLTVADRWFYFPIIGLLGMLGIFFTALDLTFLKNQYFKTCGIILACSLIVVFSLQTMIRILQWQSAIQLYSHDVQYVGESPVMYNYYGALLLTNGEYAKAKPYLEESVAIDPQLGSNIDNLAVWYEDTKNFSYAKKLYWKNIQFNTKRSQYNAISYEGLARISLIDDKNPKETKTVTTTGLQRYPLDIQLLEYLAAADYQLGEKTNALSIIKKAYDAAPDAQNQRLYLLIKTNTLQ